MFKLKHALSLSVFIAAFYCPVIARAEVIASGPDHYTLKQEATSELSPAQVWARVMNPALWWHHSYSGDSDNFTLDARAGGMWLERWDGGEVEHGRILYIKHGEQLRLDAPFGPLQEMAVRVIWTITVSEHEGGSKVVFDEVASGSSQSGLENIAPAVDRVKAEGLIRLVNPETILSE